MIPDIRTEVRTCSTKTCMPWSIPPRSLKPHDLDVSGRERWTLISDITGGELEVDRRKREGGAIAVREQCQLEIDGKCARSVLNVGGDSTRIQVEVCRTGDVRRPLELVNSTGWFVRRKERAFPCETNAHPRLNRALKPRPQTTPPYHAPNHTPKIRTQCKC